jgi:hypothetical protein
MLLRIQPDESLRSYVERNLFLQLRNPDLDIFRSPNFRYYSWDNSQVISIAEIFGWYGCYGFNKLVHLHTDYHFRSVLKSDSSFAYSESEFVTANYCFDSLKVSRSYCPICVKQDIHDIGYSYWRRLHPKVTVCARHNVNLLLYCLFCGKPFSRGGHALSVLWSGCGGRCLGDAQATMNTD